jgi:hypothetical protein
VLPGDAGLRGGETKKISKRIESPEYQSPLRKAIREWAGAESQEKRKLIRNILAHAADASITSDDVVRMFIQWISVGHVRADATQTESKLERRSVAAMGWYSVPLLYGRLLTVDLLGPELCHMLFP